jgi:hypothetical protein
LDEVVSRAFGMLVRWSSAWDDEFTVLVVWSKDSVKSGEMNSWPRDKGGEYFTPQAIE